MQSLIDMLRSGEVLVNFQKKDGSNRLMHCTLSEKYIPESKMPKGTGKQSNSDVLPVFDTQKHEWRSFRLDSVRSYEKR